MRAEEVHSLAGPAWKGCPADLDSAWRKIWQVAHDDISERGWRDAYHPTLERYTRALKTASEALEAHNQAPTSFGSTGQAVVSPHWKVYVEATRVADKAASDLLLTPAARARVGDQERPAVGGKFGGLSSVG